MKWSCVHSCRRRSLHRGLPPTRARRARQRHGARDGRVGPRRMYVDRIALYRARGPLPYPMGPLVPPATVTPGKLLASLPYHPQGSGYDKCSAPPTTTKVASPQSVVSFVFLTMMSSSHRCFVEFNFCACSHFRCSALPFMHTESQTQSFNTVEKNHETVRIIETVRTRLEDLTNVADECH